MGDRDFRWQDGSKKEGGNEDMGKETWNSHAAELTEELAPLAMELAMDVASLAAELAIDVASLAAELAIDVASLAAEEALLATEVAADSTAELAALAAEETADSTAEVAWRLLRGPALTEPMAARATTAMLESILMICWKC
jgi:hypothetical protein